MFLIFFFKQKTAYEMRISDWSSDVCSSDLVTTPASIAAAIEMGLKVDPNSYTESVTLLRRASLLPLMSLLGLKTGSDAMAMTSPVLASSTSPVPQNGRAACRERVCQ